MQAARKTVFRAGTRLSYQGFDLNNTETILRNSGGTAQTVLNIAFPTYIAGQAPPEASGEQPECRFNLYPFSTAGVTLQHQLTRQSRTGFAQRLEVRRQRRYDARRTRRPNPQHQCAFSRHASAG